MAACIEYFLGGDDFDAALGFFFSYYYSERRLTQFKRSLQGKKIITNARCAL